jgi:GntR family transcriptional regulator/MocR family aminotransferase
MSRRVSTAPLLGLGLERASPEPLHRQIYGQIRDAILSGRLAPRGHLPSTRALAAELGVSRNTVALAFEQLLSEGYVEGRVGSGTYVSGVLPDALLSARGVRARGAGGAAPAGPGPRRLSRRGETLAALLPPRGTAFPTFALGLPDLDAFPAETWGRILGRFWRRPPRDLFTARDPRGYPPLREAVAAYLRAVRALDCEAGQVMVTAGAQAGLDLAARVLLDRGDRVWVEEPGYRGLRAALVAAGAEPVAVPVDAEGISVETGRRLAPDARLAAVSPSHQFPLGVTMSLARRLALLDWARAADAWVLEDDYDSEYRYAGRPLAALQGLDQGGRVIYVGSFSKVMFPTLRLGYLVLPPDLVDAFARARAAVDDSASIVAQPALAAFIADGHFSAHVRRTRARYAARQAALVEAAGRRLGGLLRLAPSEAGMHLVAAIEAAVPGDDRAVARAAAARRVTVTPLSDYYAAAPDRRGLLLGYTGADEAAIAAGVERLAAALRA